MSLCCACVLKLCSTYVCILSVYQHMHMFVFVLLASALIWCFHWAPCGDCNILSSICCMADWHLLQSNKPQKKHRFIMAITNPSLSLTSHVSNLWEGIIFGCIVVFTPIYGRLDICFVQVGRSIMSRQFYHMSGGCGDPLLSLNCQRPLLEAVMLCLERGWMTILVGSM